MQPHRRRARLPTLGSSIRTLDTTTARPAPKYTDPIYSTPEYRAWRATVIRRAGGRCQDPDCRTPARAAGQRLYADHVVELQDGGAPFDPANGLARCASCHTRKTARERARRMARKH